MTTQNEPQLSAEMEKRFREKFTAFNNVYADMTELEAFIATVLEEQKQSIIQEIVDKYGDYRFVVKKGFGYKIGRTLRFFLLPHFQHKKGDDYENL